MSIAKIRQVKKEIRVLGLSVRTAKDQKYFHVVGAIFRGRFWLDGVIYAVAQGPDITGEAANIVKVSPHHPQIRVILLQKVQFEGGARIDPFKLSVATARPVIVLEGDEAAASESRFRNGLFGQKSEMRREDGLLFFLSIGLPNRVAARVIEVSTREGPLPEALRVAELIASAALDKQKV